MDLFAKGVAPAPQRLILDGPRGTGSFGLTVQARVIDAINGLIVLTPQSRSGVHVLWDNRELIEWLAHSARKRVGIGLPNPERGARESRGNTHVRL